MQRLEEASPPQVRVEYLKEGGDTREGQESRSREADRQCLGWLEATRSLRQTQVERREVDPGKRKH